MTPVSDFSLLAASFVAMGSRRLADVQGDIFETRVTNASFTQEQTLAKTRAMSEMRTIRTYADAARSVALAKVPLNAARSVQRNYSQADVFCWVGSHRPEPVNLRGRTAGLACKKIRPTAAIRR